MCQCPCRVLEISDQVRTVLGQSAAECSITPAPAHSEGGDSATSVAARRACKVKPLKQDRHACARRGGHLCTALLRKALHHTCRERKQLLHAMLNHS